ncbi:MAG: diaminopimelate epimerase [Candidatus Zixiibacteriota bacterium]
MKIPYAKYHALENDFLIIEARRVRTPRGRLNSLAIALCHRRCGVGADGMLYLSAGRRADCRMDVYNADGSWAEKSGNGLRIVGAHLHLAGRKKSRSFEVETADGVDRVSVSKVKGNRFVVTAGLGAPEFEARCIPVKTRRKYMINAPLKLGGVGLPVTCVAIGNPHTVLFVDHFEFDWPTVGAEIERHRRFPNRTNVEFVKVVNRGKLRVAEWERGAGATGSSGTGAAAAVCAAVVNGLANRKCEVTFETGSLQVDWDEQTNLLRLTGPIEYLGEGVFEFS